MSKSVGKVDETKRPVPYVVWEWQGVAHYDHVRYRAVRVGAAKDDWIVESWNSDTNAMGVPVWKTVHGDGSIDTFDAFDAFLWMLREQKTEGLAANAKAAK